MLDGTLNREALGLIPWVVGSWVLAVLTGMQAWFVRRLGRVGRGIARFLEGPGLLLAPGEVLLLAYGLGVPYAALVFGFLDAAEVGLVGFSWWGTLGRGAAIAGGMLLLAGWAWGAYLRAGTPPAGLLARSRRLQAQPAGWPLLLLWAAAEQAHWALYRALPALLWGAGPGLWLGLLLVLAERYLLPQTSARLRRDGGVEEEAWWLTRALALTVAWALLGNLWLCILLQVLLEIEIAWLVGRRAAKPTQVEEPSAPVLSALLLAAVVAVLLSVLFAWGALQPLPAPPPPPAAVVVPSPDQPVPTPTPTATPLPSPPPSPTPVPTGTPQPPVTAEPTPPLTYVVQAGDTLNAIAMAFDVPVVDLMRVNGISDPQTLQVGQVLVIP